MGDHRRPGLVLRTASHTLNILVVIPANSRLSFQRQLRICSERDPRRPSGLSRPPRIEKVTKTEVTHVGLINELESILSRGNKLISNPESAFRLGFLLRLMRYRICFTLPGSRNPHRHAREKSTSAYQNSLQNTRCRAVMAQRLRRRTCPRIG